MVPVRELSSATKAYPLGNRSVTRTPVASLYPAALDRVRVNVTLVTPPGWEKSPGSKAEFDEAVRCGIRTYSGVEAFLSSHVVQ